MGDPSRPFQRHVFRPLTADEFRRSTGITRQDEDDARAILEAVGLLDAAGRPVARPGVKVAAKRRLKRRKA